MNIAKPGGALAIDVQGLTKRFGSKLAVDHIDIQVPEGEVWGFLGPNGSGKTTTIRMLCGLLTVDDGQGTCLGYDIRREPEKIKRQVGYMTQRFSLYEDLSIRENLDFVARMYAVPERRRTVDEALERRGLAGRQRQLAGALSGGWKQRLALASCILHRPRLLLLDEPTEGLAPVIIQQIGRVIRTLKERGFTILLVEQNFRFAATVADRHYVVEHGRVIDMIENSELAQKTDRLHEYLGV